MHHVFVYGTLKQGFHNHHLLRTAEFVSKGKTSRPLQMRSAGGYPVVFDVNTSDVAPVSGEIFQVSDATLARLDSLEGHPNWYCRKRIFVDREQEDMPIECWMYVGVPSAWKNRDSLQLVPAINGASTWRAK